MRILLLLASLLLFTLSEAAAQQATASLTASVTVVESVNFAVEPGTFTRDRTGSYLDVTTPVRIGGRTPHVVRVESAEPGRDEFGSRRTAGRAGELHVRVPAPSPGAAAAPVGVRYVITLVS